MRNGVTPKEVQLLKGTINPLLNEKYVAEEI